MNSKKDLDSETTDIQKKSFPAKYDRGNVSFEHSLFKLHLGTFLRNISYKHLRPEIEKVEHVHFWHSVDKKGKPNKYSTPTGGHFHEIKVFWDKPSIKQTLKDEDGNEYQYEGPQFECSSALHFVKVKLPGGRIIKKINNVKFERVDEKTGETSYIIDDHKHFMEYRGSEHIVIKNLQAKIQNEKAKIQSIMDSSHLATQAANYNMLQRGEYSNTQQTKVE